MSVDPRLEKGPAFLQLPARRTQISDGDWPTYRCDMARSGRARAGLSPNLKPLWSTELSTRGSAPVVVGEMVFVCDVDAHAVCAFDTTSGKERWRFVAGGRVDTPPTLHSGLLLFGSRDGSVYTW